MRLLPHALLKSLAVLFWAALVTSTNLALACPRINGLRDYNGCDGKVVLAFFGDSLTYGVGDPTASNTSGGYPGLVGRRLPNAEIRKYAVPGLTAMQLWRYIHRTNVKATFNDIDYAIVTIGTNNYWARTQHVEVVRRIARIIKYIRKFGAVATAATVPPTVRTTPQRDYLAALNSAILINLLPKVRFDLLPTESKYYVYDGLHMTRQGYRNMANVARRFFTTSAQTIAASLHPDHDNDGIEDIFETTNYGTNPNDSDTDNDGLKDGEEVFTYLTDPLQSDTDGDGLSDGYEVSVGRDPLSYGN